MLKGIVSALFMITAVSCMRDDGIVDPPDREGLRPMARYAGVAISESDTAIPVGRIKNLVNPKIALVWQFVGVRAYRETRSETVVLTQPPFNFSARLLDPPPPEVLNQSELAIGNFWLYSDRDGNGRLERLIHPELQAKNRVIDSMHREFLLSNDSLVRAARYDPVASNVSDTYYLGKFGAVISATGAEEDTLWQGSSEREAPLWSMYLGVRYQLLVSFSRWERFFALRKKEEDRAIFLRPSSLHAQIVEYHHKQRLYPLPGRAEEFERLLRKATLQRMRLLLDYDANQSEARAKGWLEYPYSGFDVDGSDWVAGRAKEHFIVYFRNRSELDELMNAERWSTFRFKGLEHVKLGYNLVRCDDQYDCSVLSEQDTISLHLGWREGYFKPPSSPVRKPLELMPATAAEPVDPEQLEGAYDYLSYRPISVVVRDRRLWISIPDQGIFQLHAADSANYYSPAGNLQVTFPGETEAGRKLILYLGPTPAVAVRDSRGRFTDAFSAAAQEVARLAERMSSELPSTLKSMSPQAFDAKGDTLMLWAGNGDTLWLRGPGLSVQPLLAYNDSDFYSPYSPLEAGLRRGVDGEISVLRLRRSERWEILPNFGYSPHMPDSLLPGLTGPLERMVSSHGGSGLDAYVGIDGKSRFSCSEDGAYLQAGDGWVYSLDRGFAVDSISLRNDGDGLILRLEGLAGGAAGLELVLCSERKQQKGRVLLSLSGGAESGAMSDILAEPHWVEMSNAAKIVSFAPIPVPADPYYVRIALLPTPEAPNFHAWNGYIVKTGQSGE